MKRNSKITLSAMMAALATVFMLLSYFPYLTYAIPAIAGLFIMVIVIEVNCKWAIGSYIASAVLVFLLSEAESKFMYIGFLGYYPILKAVLERMRKPVAEWIVKILCFNAAVCVIYAAMSGVLGISIEDFTVFGKNGVLILLVLGNIVFVLYDIAVSRVATTYIGLIHPKLKKIIK